MRTRRVRGTGLLLAAGCSAGGSAAGTPGLEKPDLTVAVVPAVDSAGFFIALENLPSPLSLPKVTAAIMSLESYPVSTGPAGSVDTAQLKRVVNIMQQFIGFDQAFNIDSMLMGGRSR